MRSGSALNSVQWNSLGPGLACGMCIRINGSGEGNGSNPISGTFDAIIDDRTCQCTLATVFPSTRMSMLPLPLSADKELSSVCGGCASGDLALALTGDGSWGISWCVSEASPPPTPHCSSLIFCCCRYAVDCNPTGNGGNVQYVYQGSNPYFIKVRGAQLSIVDLTKSSDPNSQHPHPSCLCASPEQRRLSDSLCVLSADDL